MLFLAGTFRLSSVASDFRFSAEIGKERGTSRLLFRLGSPAFIDLVRPGSSERLLVCPGESPLQKIKFLPRGSGGLFHVHVL